MEKKNTGVLCEDMLWEILSRLPVKSLVRFMCVSKYFQSLISDPLFVTMHLQNSPKSTNFLLRYLHEDKYSCFVVPSPVTSLFENSKPLFTVDIAHGSKDQVLGSHNGLVCLAKWNEKGPMFHLWNPATQGIFGNLILPEVKELEMLGFGYDNSSHIYKVVAIVIHPNSKDYPLQTLIGNLNDESGWREIQDFPADSTIVVGDGICLNNTINWLGILNYKDYYDEVDGYDDDEDENFISFDEVVIASLDLETETYTQMLLPRELNGVFVRDFYPLGEVLHCNEAPLIGVLGGFLSLYLHNRDTKYLSIWQMKEFGNRRSWTLLLNISLQDLGVNLYSLLLPICIIENDRNIVIIHSSFQDCIKQTIIYNTKDKTVTSRNMTENLLWIYPFHYVESLVSLLHR